jgi:hypothetical protein
MCRNCWVEAECPRIVTEKTLIGADLIQAIYDTDDGGAGGIAHIVVDDWNLDDNSINYCLKEKDSGLCEETVKASIACLIYLKTLTHEERYSAMAIQSKYINAP